MGKLRQHNKLDSLMTEALIQEHPDWSMEVVREAALICSNALLQKPDTTFLQENTGLSRLLDKYGRDIAVSGLDNRGFSTSAQKILKELEASILKLFQRETKRAKVRNIENALEWLMDKVGDTDISEREYQLLRADVNNYERILQESEEK